MAENNEKTFVNIAFYRFVKLSQLPQLKDTILEACLKFEIKGTIILAQEGINSCLVGSSENIDKICHFLESFEEFKGIDFKKSISTHVPFRRMIIKVKKEIIPMGMESIDPENFTGAYVEPLELQQWLAEGQDVVFLDTRNDYEVSLGKFREAIDPKLKVFRDFPEWVDRNFHDYKDKKIVTYCTGGIRCEKASAYMRQQGFENVYQIHGGILKYFEETAQKPETDNFYEGDCFVFDYRVAVDQKLQQTNYEICYSCWTPLTQEDKQSPLYQVDKHCPHCADSVLAREEKRKLKMEENNKAALAQRIERAKKMRQEGLSQQPLE